MLLLAEAGVAVQFVSLLLRRRRAVARRFDGDECWPGKGACASARQPRWLCGRFRPCAARPVGQPKTQKLGRPRPRRDGSLASSSASRRVIEFLGATLPFLGSVKRVLQQNGIGPFGPYKPLSVLTRCDIRAFILVYLVLLSVCAHAPSSR